MPPRRVNSVAGEDESDGAEPAAGRHRVPRMRAVTIVLGMGL
jgi:hypothetical protein